MECNEHVHDSDDDGACCAALSVLASRTLFGLVTDFMPGVPFFVLAFAKRVEPQYKPVYTRWFRQWRGVLPFLAVKENDLRVLAALCELQRSPRHRANVKLQLHRVVLAAAKYGRLEILRWLYSRRLEAAASGVAHVAWDPGLLREAIAHGHVDVMHWLHTTCPSESGSVRDIDWLEHAHTLEVVQWLHAHGFAFTVREMDCAAEFGHADVVRFLHTHRSEGCSTRAMDAAAEYGHLEIVRFLHEHRSEGCSTRAMDCAAARGHLDVVRFLHEHRREGCTVDAMDAAAMNRHADVVAFLGQHRREGCSPTALLKAAASGDARTVQALCIHSARGCLLDARRIAMVWRHADVVAVLDAFLSECVQSCSMAQHSPDDARRRCQKPQPPSLSMHQHSHLSSEQRQPLKQQQSLVPWRGSCWHIDGLCGRILWGLCAGSNRRLPLLLCPSSMYYAHLLQPT